MAVAVSAAAVEIVEAAGPGWRSAVVAVVVAVAAVGAELVVVEAAETVGLTDLAAERIERTRREDAAVVAAAVDPEFGASLAAAAAAAAVVAAGVSAVEVVPAVAGSVIGVATGELVDFEIVVEAVVVVVVVVVAAAAAAVAVAESVRTERGLYWCFAQRSTGLELTQRWRAVFAAVVGAVAVVVAARQQAAQTMRSWTVQIMM